MCLSVNSNLTDDLLRKDDSSMDIQHVVPGSPVLGNVTIENYRNDPQASLQRQNAYATKLLEHIGSSRSKTKDKVEV